MFNNEEYKIVNKIKDYHDIKIKFKNIFSDKNNKLINSSNKIVYLHVLESYKLNFFKEVNLINGVDVVNCQCMSFPIFFNIKKLLGLNFGGIIKINDLSKVYRVFEKFEFLTMINIFIFNNNRISYYVHIGCFFPYTMDTHLSSTNNNTPIISATKSLTSPFRKPK